MATAALLERSETTLNLTAGSPRRPVLAYDTNFDRQAYQNLYSLTFLDQSEFQRRKKLLDAEIEFNLRTHLGERFNVLLSTLRYNVRDGVIYGENSDEASINIFIRGRDYRRQVGNPADFAREDAEIEGFQKIQAILANPNAKPGEMMLSISPRGGTDSTYQHNFYDVFTLKEDGKGRYLEARRYGSTLNVQEYSEKLKDRLDIDIFPNAESLLANPQYINPESSYYKNADDIHQDFHLGGNFMDSETFTTKALPAVEQIGKEYIRRLNEDYTDKEGSNLVFNAYLNAADQAVFRPKATTISADWQMPIGVRINLLGNMKVRPVMVGCGLSGGAIQADSMDRFNTISMMRPFSVADFGKTSDGNSLTFECPSCKQTNTRQPGTRLAGCQHCPQKFERC